MAAPVTAAPTSTPQGPSTLAPTVTASTSAPSTAAACPVPQLVGNWVNAKNYPLHVAEAQGVQIGVDLVLISGFVDGYTNCTAESYALDTSDPLAEWRKMDDLPQSLSEGVTHAASALIGSKFYMCGGYYGGHPGLALGDCLVYDHSIEPNTTGQWSFLPSLPEDRAGGGMVYSTAQNALYFAAGAFRPNKGKVLAIDHSDAWKLDLGDLAAGWQVMPSIPYHANHISFVTAFDDNGAERHYFVGGQEGENEKAGNMADNFEWDDVNENWITRADMPMARGHAASSTRAISCGYIIAAGSTNNGRTTDISYYDIPTDSWFHVGHMTNSINTPVCDIDPSSTLQCQSGRAKANYAKKIQITV